MANKKYQIQRNPFRVPTDDGKIIEEHFGMASIPTDMSIAHMIAPPGWSEPFQRPEFDEYTIVIRGKKQIIVDDETLILNSGESIKINKGVRVQYSNPFKEACEYIAICKPPFTLEKSNRES